MKAAAARVVVRHGPATLLLFRGPTAPWAPNHWDVPGGLVGANETPEMAARRELQEEAGISGATLRPLVVRDLPWGRVHYFRASVTSDAVVLSSEHTQALWAKPADIRHLKLIPGLAPLLAPTSFRGLYG